MKALLLLAGRGRRLKQITDNTHKSMIKIGNEPLLYHLIKNIEDSGIKEIIPVVGYKGEEVLNFINKIVSSTTKITPIWNEHYEHTNNLYSLVCAEKEILNHNFVLINGDLIFNKNILSELIKNPDKAEIAIDDSPKKHPIDSPGVMAKNERLFDLGRHILFENNCGYAIGMYKFNKELSNLFFDKSKELLKENLNHGFHDPLIHLFNDYPVYLHSTKGLSWTDIDEESDIDYAKSIFNKIQKEINKC